MKRFALFLLLLPCLGCQQWGTRQVPLQFSKKWVAGDAEIGRRGKAGVPVTIRLRLGDEETFQKPLGMPCHRVQLRYRQTPAGASKILGPNWSHLGFLLSHEPKLCFQGTTEWLWYLLIVPERTLPERGELSPVVDGRLVFVTQREPTATEEISVIVLTIPQTSDDWDKQSREGDEPFIVARSQWLPIGTR